MNTIEFEISEVSPGGNVWERMNRFKRKELKDRWTWLLLSKCKARFKGKVRITYTRISPKLLDPMDNLPTSFKPIGDALQKAGIIENDGTDYVECVIKQFQGPPKTIIKIEKI